MEEANDLVIRKTTQLEEKTKPGKFFQWTSALTGVQRRLGEDRKTAPEVFYQTREEAMKNKPEGDLWSLCETEENFD